MPGVVMFPEFDGKSYGLNEISPAETQQGIFELFGYSSSIARYNSECNAVTLAAYDKNDNLTVVPTPPPSDSLASIRYCMDVYTIRTLPGQCIDLGTTRLVYDADEAHGKLLLGQNSVVLFPPTDYEHLPKHRPDGPALHVTVSDTDLDSKERFR